MPCKASRRVEFFPKVHSGAGFFLQKRTLIQRPRANHQNSMQIDSSNSTRFCSGPQFPGNGFTDFRAAFAISTLRLFIVPSWPLGLKSGYDVGLGANPDINVPSLPPWVKGVGQKGHMWGHVGHRHTHVHNSQCGSDDSWRRHGRRRARRLALHRRSKERQSPRPQWPRPQWPRQPRRRPPCTRQPILHPAKRSAIGRGTNATRRRGSMPRAAPLATG